MAKRKHGNLKLQKRLIDIVEKEKGRADKKAVLSTTLSKRGSQKAYAESDKHTSNVRNIMRFFNYSETLSNTSLT
ncbi:hypothetical protein K6Q96_02040 [Grimontia kaedaensis]|uniref:Alternative ribosome-rescue factor A n=1 Tax=Grimontia kaedaensis TaxID=2872157 RepID=A0ABY4WV01_9GAMM|nr:hypothetical protein [Grimontia kaedaensis]USH02845.1 hypothetical protein K6Q96_02040 [Grimontia kaedaensis]